MTAGRFMGQSVARREDPRLLTGHGHYIEDVVLPGMLHAAFVRSDVARGRIVRLDVSAARAVPGVHAVLKGSEINVCVHETWWHMGGKEAMYPPKGALADGDVRYVGDPIAIVIAESRYIAEDAAELVEVEIESMPPILDVDVAIAATDDFVHPELGTNTPQVIPAFPDAELDQIFADAAHHVTATFGEHRYVAVPMETRGTVASWDPYAKQLLVYASTQSAHVLRGFYARLLDIPENNVRVIAPDVGGGFGLKVMALRDEWAVVIASVLLGTPVRWIEDRRENLIASAHARDERMSLEVAVDADGQLQAIRGHLVENVGAYPYAASGSGAALVMLFLSGAYKIPKTGFSAAATYTNTCGRAPYRGPFLMQTVGPEQMVDVVARAIGMDPLELRRRNVIRAEDLPYTLPSFLPYDSITAHETLEQAAAVIDYDGFRQEQAKARDEGRYIGIGISLCVEPSAIAFGALATEGVEVRMEPSGKVTCILSSSSTGMSVETTALQVLAEHLGCDMDDITFMQADTLVAPFGGGTQGSRSAVLYGNVVRQAAVEMREKVVAIAAHLLEASAEDLEVESSTVRVKGTPAKSLSFEQIAETAYISSDALPPGMTPGLEVMSRYKAPPFTFSNACHMCTCEVDIVTGQVTILRYVVSEDCGQMINPKVVEGQIFGGVVQGIGGVLYEHLVYDDAGNPLTATFADYLLPTAAEVPTIEVVHLESAASNPLGVKGMGEGGAIASPAAVFNAVADALAPLGVEVRDTPLGPSQIAALLEAAGH
jgi:aerobic carbon-monoxide dehydrogenase large subunit